MAGRGGKTRTSGQGRPKGALNKFTADLKEMILGALAAKPGGGQAYLERQADENPVAFMALVGKLLPKDVIVDATVNVNDERAETEALIRELSAQPVAVSRH